MQRANSATMKPADCWHGRRRGAATRRTDRGTRSVASLDHGRGRGLGWRWSRSPWDVSVACLRPAALCRRDSHKLAKLPSPTRDRGWHATCHGHPVETRADAILEDIRIARHAESSRRSHHLRRSQWTRSSPFSRHRPWARDLPSAADMAESDPGRHTRSGFRRRRELDQR